MQTLQASSQAEITVKGSRFLAYAYPVREAQSALAWVKFQQEQHPKARHWCYAYRLGITGADYRANDDGEPSGTAGLPILQQLQSLEVSDSVVVVVRYFGGTLLGVSGLIKAYKQSAREALLAAQTVEIIEEVSLNVQCAYQELSAVLGLCKRHQAEIIGQEVGLSCWVRVRLPKERALALQSALTEARFVVEAELG